MYVKKSAVMTIKYKEAMAFWNYHFFFSRQYYGPMHLSYQRHNHDFFEFFLVESGNVIHQINDGQELLQPGDLRFILPSDTHQLIPEDGKEFFIYNGNIEKELFLNCFHLLTEGEISPDDLLRVVHLNGEAFTDLLDRLKSLIFWTNSANKYQTRLDGRLLIIYILKIFLKLHDGSIYRPAWLEQLCTQIQKPENLCQGVHRLFELTNYSTEHVSRTIKKYLGITPQQLVLEYKLQNVVRDLTYTNLPINRVALQNGFRNYAYFNAVFVKRYKTTPLHFRKNYVSKVQK